ncbi:hypothetical protein HOLleu_42217 [Holothuria leucospilota]|uniref:Uncharacterized protein n=1 Tax=Holothuria leucospilota TaxID=206669 RepID=A0A9Q1B9D6_HOLLE|nr:hypothetical protein HOLleu_42217 [Holothuria leucospilota]
MAFVEIKEILANEVLIDVVVDSDIRWEIYRAYSKSLEEAVCISAELEAFNLAEQKKGATEKLGVRTLLDKMSETNGKANSAPSDAINDLATVMT